MSPIKKSTIAKRVAEKLRKTDFRFDGNPNDTTDFWSEVYTFDKTIVKIELLWEYVTESTENWPATREQPAEYMIKTHIRGIREFYVYVEPEDDELRKMIEAETPVAIIDALEKYGRTSKTIV